VPIELPVAWIITLNVLGWPLIQLGLAWGFTRLPERWFEVPERRLARTRGRMYERWFLIKHWKDRLPDAAAWFGGGFAKASLNGTDAEYLRRFIRETRRGEVCHWCAMACLPVFFLWNPLWADWVMIGYAVAANVPCILAQRYNRLRLRRLLARSPRPGEPKAGTGPPRRSPE
jgi:glycosyl-4,4'-diaponeurosporenoate acyltransferase